MGRRIGDVTGNGHRPVARLLDGLVQLVTTPGHQGHVRPPLGETDADASTEPARCTHHNRLHVRIAPYVIGEPNLASSSARSTRRSSLPVSLNGNSVRMSIRSGVLVERSWALT